MESLYNPFALGAGTPPPELAGRSEILREVQESYLRARMGLPCRPYLLLGLRGVGKTVLLNAIASGAKKDGIIVSKIESPETEPLADLLYPAMGKALRSLSATEKAKEIGTKGLRALRSFASALKVRYGDLEIGIEPEPGVADTGNLEYDLWDMFELIGETAKKANQAWLLLIDEIQYLKQKDLAALIVALHLSAQAGLPIVLVGAGLPQVARLAGNAKSYAERLFLFPHIGPLTPEEIDDAVTTPLKRREVSINPDALEEIIRGTRGYPFFIQTWAYNAWNIAENPRITLEDVRSSYAKTLHSLDEGFFKVRYDRLTEKEMEFVGAMTTLGKGPYAVSDIQKVLKVPSSRISPVRASLIAKGMTYSPRHGYLDFSVPLFDEFLLRNHRATL